MIESLISYLQLWRIRHDAELGPLWRDAPEVFPLNEERTPFTADWQRLTFALNPGMNGDRWRILYGNTTAFMNHSGFPTDADPTPHADFVNQMDLNSPLGAWDKTRTIGGATHAGIVDGSDLIVEILDGLQPAPDLNWLLARPWLYFRALWVYEDGHVGNFPQNGGQPVLVPLVGHGIARLPLKNVQRVYAIADPYRVN